MGIAAATGLILVCATIWFSRTILGNVPPPRFATANPFPRSRGGTFDLSEESRSSSTTIPRRCASFFCNEHVFFSWGRSGCEESGGCRTDYRAHRGTSALYFTISRTARLSSRGGAAVLWTQSTPH